MKTPYYFKSEPFFVFIGSDKVAVVITNNNRIHSTSDFNLYLQDEHTEITKEEFNEQFNKVINHLKSII